MSKIDINITMTREQLLEHLQRQKKRASHRDRCERRQREEAEREFVKEWRARCRAAAKWTYDEIQARYNELRVTGYSDRVALREPAALSLLEPAFDRLIAQVELSNQQKWTISTNQNAHMHRLVIWAPSEED